MKKQFISKRAIGLEDVKKAIFHLWHPNEGPLQNIFKLLSYLTPFIPGLGLMIFVVEKVASISGYGLEGLGKYLDQQLGLNSNSNINQEHINKGGELLEKLVVAKMASSTSEELVKIAFLGSVLKFAIKSSFKLILKVVPLLLLAVGVDQISDLYKKVQEKGVLGYMAEKTQENLLSGNQNILQNEGENELE